MGQSIQRYPSPLRYPGGKGKVANFLKLLILRNGLIDCHYAEPYAGGASVALSLLYEEYASHIHINDLNATIFAFWGAVLNNADELCRRIERAAITMREWERQRVVQAAKEPDPLDLAFSTFFLNRTNRSGIINGGVIGGKCQNGDWKLDARFNKEDLIRRIQKVARYRRRITLSRMNAADFLKESVSTLPQQALVYLDPPYYAKGEGLYEHFYQHADHVEVRRLIHRLKRPWVVSYDAVPEILELYSGLDRIVYQLSYSAADRYHGAEVMFFSPVLKKPCVESPANIEGTVLDRLRREALSEAS